MRLLGVGLPKCSFDSFDVFDVFDASNLSGGFSTSVLSCTSLVILLVLLDFFRHGVILLDFWDASFDISYTVFDNFDVFDASKMGASVLSCLSLVSMFQNCAMLWCSLWLFRSWGKSFSPVSAETRSKTRPRRPRAGF